MLSNTLCNPPTVELRLELFKKMQYKIVPIQNSSESVPVLFWFYFDYSVVLVRTRIRKVRDEGS